MPPTTSFDENLATEDAALTSTGSPTYASTTPLTPRANPEAVAAARIPRSRDFRLLNIYVPLSRHSLYIGLANARANKKKEARKPLEQALYLRSVAFPSWSAQGHHRERERENQAQKELSTDRQRFVKNSPIGNSPAPIEGISFWNILIKKNILQSKKPDRLDPASCLTYLAPARRSSPSSPSPNRGWQAAPSSNRKDGGSARRRWSQRRREATDRCR